MKKQNRFRRGFRITDHSGDRARDVEDEIAFHHAMRERELIDSGMDPAEARRKAREVFGDEARIRAEVERIDARASLRQRVTQHASALAQDIRLGLRGLRRSPLFAAVAVATLALGIGGNTVVFSLVEAIVMRAPAVESPDRLASIWTTCRRGDPRCSSSHPDYEDYRDRSTRFSDMAAYTGRRVTADAGGEPEVVGAELVTANYFSLLGLEPAAGRVLQPQDDVPDSDPAVLVLSNAWWKTRFGGDRTVIGSTLRVNGIPYTVLGVAPAEFDGLVLGQAPEFWMLLRSLRLLDEDRGEMLQSRSSRWIQGLVGRLAAGATVEGARAEMLRISDQLAVEDPDSRGTRSITVDALSSRVGGSEASIFSFLAMLQGVLALTLLLACSNLANLMLARATTRRSELGVRLALGIGRARLVRQQLVESLIIASAGGVVATVLALALLRLIGGVALPRGIEISATGAGLNAGVLLFAALTTVGAAVLFGWLPALIAGRTPLGLVLRQQRTGGGSAAARVRSALIGLQVSLAVVLLVGASLFIGTMRNRLDVDLGFDAHNVALVVVDPTLGGIDPEAAATVGPRILERISGLPGVRSAALGRSIPVRPGGNGTFVEVDGYQAAPDEEMRIEYSVVTGDYLKTLALPVISGRDFEPADGGAGEPVVIIDETMATRWWPDRDPVGGTVHVGESSFRVAGVARRTAWGGLDVGTTPFMFIAAGQGRSPDGPYTVIVRTDSNPTRMLPAIRQAIRETYPGLAIRQMGTMQAEIDSLLAPQRTAAWLLSAFGLLAVTLAGIGIWGVVSYSVARQRRDLSIRIALGATRTGVVRRVARTTLSPIAVGLVFGLTGARFLSSSVDSFLFGLTGTHPLSYFAAGILLAVVAVTATWLPARRAATTNPVEAMRAD